MRHYGITQSQHCNNDNIHNDDNVIRASVWCDFLGGLFNVKNHDIWEGKYGNKEWDLNYGHPFPRILGYKRRDGIKKIDNTEFKVYNNSMHESFGLVLNDNLIQISCWVSNWVLGYTRPLECSWAPLSCALQIVTQLVCSCLSLSDAIVELHSTDGKNVKWLSH